MKELPPFLIYYGSYQGVSKILKQQSLPLFDADDLGDPFLSSKTTGLNFDCQELFERVVKVMSSAILGKAPPQGNPNHPLQKAMKRWRSENRFNNEEEIRGSLVGLLPAMVEQSFNQAKESNEQWLKFVENKRLLPFFESVNDQDLWMLEANKYSGVAIKFKSTEDSVFEHCHAVDYSRKPEKPVDLDDYVDFLIGEKQEIEQDFQKLLLTQNTKYRLQKEWRLLIDRNNKEDSYLNIPADLIQSIFIGAMVSKEDAAKLQELVAQLNKKAELANPINIFETKCSSKSYELNFEKL